MLRIALATFAAVLLCVVAPARAQQTPDPRQEIAGAVQLTPPASLANAEVSDVHSTHGPQIGDAMACLRLSGGASGYIAVFFEGGHVINYRRAVAVDRCETLAYAPLPAPPAPAGKKGRKRQSAAPKATAQAMTPTRSAAVAE